MLRCTRPMLRATRATAAGVRRPGHVLRAGLAAPARPPPWAREYQEGAHAGWWQGGAADERATILGLGTVLGLGLGSANLALQRYVTDHPQSALAVDVDDDTRSNCHYVVPISATAAGLGLWIAAVMTRPLSGAAATGWMGWWFGVQRQWATTGLLSLTAGHYAQEIVTNKWCGPVILAHHVVAIGIAFSTQAASCCRGMLISWGAIYEVGSLLLCLGYVGIIPRVVGHWAVTLSSVAGMGCGLHCLSRRKVIPRLNAAVWFNVTTLLAIGIGRVQEATDHLSKLLKKKSA